MINDLVKQAQNGEAEAFGELYEIYADKIYAYIYYKIGVREDAEDLSARVFERALQKLSSYRKNISFQAWLFTIARNMVTDHWRKKKDMQSLTDFNDFPTNDNSLDKTSRNEDLKNLLYCFRQLEPIEKDVISLRFFSELNVAETAKILGKSEGATRILQHRALKKMKEILTNHGR